jgi:hypothetical protein
MKNLLRSALVLCAIVAVNAQAACRKGGCGKRVARYAVASRSGFRNAKQQPTAQQPVVRRGGCANGSCSL